MRPSPTSPNRAHRAHPARFRRRRLARRRHRRRCGGRRAGAEPARGPDASTRIVEGVHFDRRFTPPDAIGHRALAVNLSDLAAMGAAPRLALLSLALPADAARCADFDGIVAASPRSPRGIGVHVVGGNLTRSPGPADDRRHASSAPSSARQVLTRGGARPGDEIYVTRHARRGARPDCEMLQAGRPAPDVSGPPTDAVHRRAICFPSRACALGLLLGAEPRRVGVHGSQRRAGRRRAPDRRSQRRRRRRSRPRPLPIEPARAPGSTRRATIR